MHDRQAMDKRDEEILELKQKLIDLLKENTEMKELILFLDDERNLARESMREITSKQSLNWNSLKQKLVHLEQKQFDLIRENYTFKQLCVLLEEKVEAPKMFVPMADKPTNQLVAKSTSSVCQYILHLENELRLRGTNPSRPKRISEALKLNSLRETLVHGSTEEKCILDSLSDTAIKSILGR